MRLITLATLAFPLAEGIRHLKKHEESSDLLQRTQDDLDGNSYDEYVTADFGGKDMDDIFGFGDLGFDDENSDEDSSSTILRKSQNNDKSDIMNVVSDANNSADDYAYMNSIAEDADEYYTQASEDGPEGASLVVANDVDSSVQGDEPSSKTKTAEKSRRHHLRRKEQYCTIQCFSNNDCVNYANSYFACSSYRTCLGNRCAQSGGGNGPRCNNFCQNNNACAGATDGCLTCMGNVCSSNRSGVRCGWNCQNNFAVCNGASDGCSFCNGVTCTRPQRCNVGCSNNSQCSGASDGCVNCIGGVCRQGGTNKCGFFCNGNPSICNNAADGCGVCNGSTCVSGGGRPTCGSPCGGPGGCTNALNGCTLCSNGFCTVDNRINTGCVSDEFQLRTQLGSGGTVTLCANANIMLSSEITTNRSNIDLRCAAPGSCTITTNSRIRLIHFQGSNIRISGITFRNANSNGSGGAILIDGTNNSINNCVFSGNSASQRGGAGAVGSGTFAGNSFSGNSAAQCFDFFIQNTGRCFSG